MIDILLSTFNGARFLPEQIDSIFRQKEHGWRLWLRDDGSGDASPTIARDCASKRPTQVRIVEDRTHLGAAQSFAQLLRKSDAPYVMLCDQEDIWLAGKIEKTLEAMKELERVYGANMPLLVHTDMQVVDEQLAPIAPSFCKVMKLHPQRVPLARLLVQNVATGCTMMLNRALADRVGVIPEGARMHDAWIALVAALFGRIHWLDAPTLSYRQHSRNEIGVRRLRKLAAIRPGDILQRSIVQAWALLDTYGRAMSSESRTVIERFIREAGGDGLVGLRLWRSGYARLPWYQNLPFIMSQLNPPKTNTSSLREKVRVRERTLQYKTRSLTLTFSRRERELRAPPAWKTNGNTTPLLIVLSISASNATR